MATDERVAEYERLGAPPMDPELAVGTLAAAVGSASPSTVVADVHWGLFAAGFTIERPSPLLTELTVPETAPQDQSGWLARTRVLPAVERERAVLAMVCGHAAVVLGHPGPESVPDRVAFSELGVDSLAAVQVRDRLRAETGLDLPPAFIFDHPTAAEVAAYLTTRLFTDEQPETGPDAEVRRILASIPIERLRVSGLLDAITALVGDENETTGPQRIDDLAPEELLSMVFDNGKD